MKLKKHRLLIQNHPSHRPARNKRCVNENDKTRQTPARKQMTSIFHCFITLSDVTLLAARFEKVLLASRVSSVVRLVTFSVKVPRPEATLSAFDEFTIV